MFIRWSLLLSVLVLSCSTASAPPAQAPTKPAPTAESGLIPLEVLFGNPTRASVTLSPDGTLLAYLAPEEGVQNVWLKTVGKNDDRAITHDRKRGIPSYFWAPDSKSILTVQDKDGDENWRVIQTKYESNEQVDLTPLTGVQAQVLAVEPGHPEAILVGLNDRDPRFHDVYRIDLATGERTLVQQNDVGAIGWVADHDLNVRIAQIITPDGGGALLARKTGKGRFQELLRWGSEDMFTQSPIGFGEDNRSLYLLSTVGSNTVELRTLDTRTRRQKVVASDPNADVLGTLLHPTRHDVLAVRFQRERGDWKVIDSDVEKDFAALRALDDGDLVIASSDDKNQHWIVAFDHDAGPVRYFAWDRAAQTSTFLFSHRPELENLPLARMRPVSYQARDGLTIHGYLTLPHGVVDPKKLPVVINPHGGPWHRDIWGFDPTAQWLANRGYAVLQPNFRGSTGYGKNFLNAADKEWGGKMQDDITDGTLWLISTGIADPKRICIMGGSYGGYATLMGLIRRPDLYACGIDIVGVANLETWFKNIPPYWKPFESVLRKRVGDPASESEFLRSRSPVFLADQIRAPLLIAQGKNDPRVPRDESIQIRDALKKNGQPVEYIEYEDEGHGFQRPENRLHFYGLAEKFLAKHLGGHTRN